MEMDSIHRSPRFPEMIAPMERVQVVEVTLATLDRKDRILVSTGEIPMGREVREALVMDLEVMEMGMVVDTVVETRDTAVELTKVREARVPKVREMVKVLEAREASDLKDRTKALVEAKFQQVLELTKELEVREAQTKESVDPIKDRAREALVIRVPELTQDMVGMELGRAKAQV